MLFFFFFVIMERGSLEVFQEWCIENGCKFPRLELKDDIAGFGSGFMIKTDIPTGVDAVVTPLKLLINAIVVRSSPLYHALCSMNIDCTDHELVWLFMVHERHKGLKSFWHPYLDILPRVPNTPLFYTDEELNAMKGTNIYHEVARLRRQGASLCSRVAPLCAARPDLLPSCTQQDMRWAQGNFMSRALLVEWPQCGVDDRQGSLVPLVDMMNHDDGAKVEYLTHPQEECFSVRNCGPLKEAHNQMFLNYGPRPPERTLMQYGFVLPNALKSFSVVAKIPSDDELRDEKMQMLQRCHLTTEVWVAEGDAWLKNAICTMRIVVSECSDEIECEGGAAALRGAIALCDALSSLLQRTIEPTIDDNHLRGLDYVRWVRRVARDALSLLRSRIDNAESIIRQNTTLNDGIMIPWNDHDLNALSNAGITCDGIQWFRHSQCPHLCAFLSLQPHWQLRIPQHIAQQLDYDNDDDDDDGNDVGVPNGFFIPRGAEGECNNDQDNDQEILVFEGDGINQYRWPWEPGTLPQIVFDQFQVNYSCKVKINDELLIV